MAKLTPEEIQELREILGRALDGDFSSPLPIKQNRPHHLDEMQPAVNKGAELVSPEFVE